MAIKDEEILKKFRDAIYPNRDRPLYYFKRNNQVAFCEVYISNKQISKALSKNGCVQAKTFSLKFPYFLDEKLHNHFIRGVFDGDGSIVLSTLKSGEHKTMFSIIGYRCFIQEINKILSQKCMLNENKLIDYKGKNQRIATVAFSGCRQCIKIRDYLYNNATIYLDRKYKKFNKLGTDEWKTYENIKENVYNYTIKVTDKFINPNDKKEYIIPCCVCGDKLSYRRKIYDINCNIYCHSCYSKLFKNNIESEYFKNSATNKFDNNKIYIIPDGKSILKIKDVNIIFDTEDYSVVNKFQWHIENNRVVHRSRYPKSTLYLNRIIMNAKNGQSVTFIDGNTFNMQKENLKLRN